MTTWQQECAGSASSHGIYYHVAGSVGAVLCEWIVGGENVRLIRTLLVVILLVCLSGLLGCALREIETPQQVVASNAAGMGGETALPDDIVRRTLAKKDGVSAIMEFLDGTEAPATWWVRYESAGEEKLLPGAGPVIMNGGDVIYVGENGTVRRLSRSGSEEVLRSGGTVGSLTPDPDEKFLAFLRMRTGTSGKLCCMISPGRMSGLSTVTLEVRTT